MPWIELHSNLREHPKTTLLVEAMGFLDADYAVGKLARLWLWALEYAPTGSLDQITEKQLARASGVDPEEGNRWLAALVSARWLDSKPHLRIHDWWDYTGYFLRKKWDKQPERWQAVEQAYAIKTAAEPQRNRSGPSASPHTSTNQTNQPTGGGERARATQVDATKPVAGAIAPPPPPGKASPLAEGLQVLDESGAPVDGAILTNKPTLAQALAYFEHSDYRGSEVQAAYRSFEASKGIDGSWWWGKRMVGDWRAALEQRMADERARKPGGAPATSAGEVLRKAAAKALREAGA